MNVVSYSTISLQNYLSVKTVSSLISQKTPRGQKLAISIIYYAISFLPYLFFEKRRIRRRGENTN